MNSRLRILILFILTLCCSVASAQVSRAKVRAVLNYKTLQPGQQAVIAIVLDVQKGYHAQSHTPLSQYLIRYEVNFDPTPNVEFGQPIYPKPELEEYPALGKVSVYTGQAITFVPVTIKAGSPVGAIKISGSATFQVCDDKSCLAPESPKLNIETQIIPAGQPLEAAEPELFTTFDPTTLAQPASASTETPVQLFGLELGHDNYLFAFAAALIVGMFFNVMPCVLPIVPLKAMGFYHAAQQNRARSLAIGAMFAAGIVSAFGALAIPVVVLRTLAWGQLFGNAWFAGTVVLILLAMALGTFGAFSVVLPQKVYEFTPTHESYVGNFLFGVLTAVLSTPCTFGMFLGLLVWAASQTPVIGTALVMNVGLGMAIPYLVLAAFPELAKNFPRTGPWAEIVKQMMGFLLIATAVFFGRQFLPESIDEKAFWWIIFGVVAASAVFLIIRTIQITNGPRAIATAIVVAAILVVPALIVTLHLTYVPVRWVKFTPEQFKTAISSGKPVLVEFTADWCGNCKAVEGTVYTDERTVAAIDKGEIVTLKADLTHADAVGWELLRSIHPVGAIPFTAIYLPGQPMPQKLAGIYTTSELLRALAGAG